jgi:short-subunit dehydrogenase
MIDRFTAVQALDRGFAIVFDSTWEDETARREEKRMNQGNTGRPLAVVTGASSGIGLELAKQFAQHNFDLLVTSAGNGIHEATKSLAGYGVDVRTVQVDLADYEGVENLYARIRETGRPVDAIAINAGVGAGGSFVNGNSLEEELNIINLNIKSSVHLAKRVVPDMVSRGSGKILFTSSIAATMPGPFSAVYHASKAFVQSFSQAIRNELKDTGVTVTALMPGATETNFFRRAHMEDTKVGASEKDDPAEVARDGFEALMAGDDHVVAGSFKNKVNTTMAHILPDTVVAEQGRKKSEPGSARKH